MKKVALSILAAAIALGVAGAQVSRPAAPVSQSASLPKRPKLIVAIILDQFRYDYLQRFRSEYKFGLRRLMTQGAVFHDARYPQAVTVTAVGHSTFLSGAIPANSGIVDNSWYDWKTGKAVQSIGDPATKPVGAPPPAKGDKFGASPQRLLASTLSDQLKMAGRDSKTIGIAMKDRAAILPGGHTASAAYWFDSGAKKWITSTYYMAALPDWVEKINAAGPARDSVDALWYALGPKTVDTRPFCTMTGVAPEVEKEGDKDKEKEDEKAKEEAKAEAERVARGAPKKCPSITASPWGNEMTEALAEEAVSMEKMGSHKDTDVLTVSFSSNDAVGHAWGPDSPQVHDITIRTDILLGKFFDFVDKTVGPGNVLYVFSADHGVAPTPEAWAKDRMIGGRTVKDDLTKAMNEALSSRYGAGKWILSGSNLPYLSRELIRSRGLDLAAVENTAADAARLVPNVFRVYTGEQIAHGQVPNDPVSTAVAAGYFPGRSSDLVIIRDPFYQAPGTGTSHGTPFGYDSHVPVIFMGGGIRPNNFYNAVRVNDIAPTLAAILDIEPPSGSVGRILSELWK